MSNPRAARRGRSAPLAAALLVAIAALALWPEPARCSSARIVLRAQGDGYYALTAYPLEEQR